ncbi:alpha/beta hydrolase fold family protein [Metarhizium album ARSEF 1941]|uniref:Alpha/beta hydrolase fold family protein n=1 Tax=Metarhizium album (strain ARSEF 1941) TaxID=1081103 RepID=A0A0B2X971_METAS|nr:alpha/beta hydrolase fold family protein [Metarhizium album ARSEF 1941]KHO02120.1 alpha/beta hydrolase fold family protein [Metarhizium album ARSEF 1941]
MPTIQIDNQALYYSWNPAGDGPILLLVHGLGSSNSFYASIIPGLVQKGYACLAFDTPGSALSTYGGREIDGEAICGAAVALITALQLDVKRVIVVGHSMGAIIASTMALHLGTLGVVLIGPVNPSAALADVMDARIKLVESEGMEGVANVVPFAATGPRATATQKAFVRALLLGQTAEGYKSLCRMIANAGRPRYEDIKCPLLIIAGSHDKTAPLPGSRDILNSWGVGPGLKRIEILADVGHWHCIEAAPEVEDLVGAFAEGVRALLQHPKHE